MRKVDPLIVENNQNRRIINLIVTEHKNFKRKSVFNILEDMLNCEESNLKTESPSIRNYTREAFGMADLARD